jgi:hypothetical protein
MAGLLDQCIIQYQYPATFTSGIFIQPDMVQLLSGPFVASKKAVQTALAAPIEGITGYVHDVFLILAVQDQSGQICLEIVKLGLAEASPVLIQSTGQWHIGTSEKHFASPNIIKPTT